MNFQPNNNLCIPNTQEHLEENNKTQAYSTPSLGPGPGPRPGPAQASALGVL